MKKRHLHSFLSIIAFFTLSLTYGQDAIRQKIQQHVPLIQNSESYSPLEKVVGNKLKNAIPITVLDEKQTFKIQNTQFQNLRNNKNKYLRIQLPIEGQNQELALMKADIFSSDFRAVAASDPNVPLNTDTGLHYWGIVSNQPNSLVCLSFFDGEMAGFINYDNKQYNLGKVENSDFHILYKNSDFNGFAGFTCEAISPAGVMPSTDLIPVQKSAIAGCVRVHIELDYSLYQDKGSDVTTASNYVYALFAQVAILYANENINTDISYMQVWDTPSPYGASDPLNDLYYQNYGTTYGDLVHVIHTLSIGGVAYISALCNSSINIGSDGIYGSFSNVPTYSWDVMVVTHEMGHNLGSLHTHACAWNGNNTAIDGCGPSEGYDEGCSGSLPSNGGTIMSYCHMTNVGMNFNLGFGQQPGDLIRNRVNNASCLGDCQCSDGIQNGDETGVDCGGSCPNACPTCTDGILNGNEIGVDCGGFDCPLCPPEDCSTYGFSGTVYSFDPDQDFGTSTVQDGGATLLVEGNVWKAIEINYTFTPNTVLEFDFKSTAQGEIHEISFDNDLIFASFNRVVVYGDQGYAGDYVITPYNGSGNFQHFVVPLGLSGSVTYQYMVLTADDDADANANSYFSNIQIYEDYDGNQSCGTCTDDIQNGNETGVDCGGPDCFACPTCFDAVQNGDETGIDCGGSCPPCYTCTDDIQNGNETGVDCGGPDCFACPTCFDAVQNGDETGIDCGGSCPACTNCNDGIQNGDETDIDCGGLDCPPCSQLIMLDICVFLEGTYDINSGAMGNTLQSMGILPATQPYNVSPWNYGGQETLTIGTGVADWVLVSLRTSTAKSSEIASAAGVLQTDGCIDFPNAADILPLDFNTPVYIVVEHRNHMGIMSAQTINVSNNVLAHDFRTAQSYVTPSTCGQKQMEDGVWCMFAGDIDPTDANSYDINGADKSIWQNQNGTFDAYLPADLDQNSDINGGDKVIWQSNNGTFSSVPR